jgi:predicted GNAT family acetyltransferase
MSSSSTLPPTVNTPPAPSIADLYGDTGRLVVAPPAPPATVTEPDPNRVRPVEALDAESPFLQHVGKAVEGAGQMVKSVVAPKGATEKERLKNIANEALIEPEKQQTIKAGEALNRADAEKAAGHPVRAALAKVEAGGHALASGVPLVGPWAAGVAEEAGQEIGRREYGAAAGDVVGNVAVGKALEEGGEATKGAVESAVSHAGETAKNAISSAGSEAGRMARATAPEGSTEAGFAKLGGKKVSAAKPAAEPVDLSPAYGATGKAIPETEVSHTGNAGSINEVKVKQGGEDIGALHFTHEGDVASVNDTWVDPKSQGQGHGQRLITEAAAAAKKNGAKVFTSDPNGETSPAAANAWDALVRRGQAEETGSTTGPKYQMNLEDQSDTSFKFGENIEPEKSTTVPDFAQKAADIAKTQGGGFTIDPRTGEVPKTGYQIEAAPEQRVTLDHPATAKDIQEFANKNRDLLDKHPELHVGGYGNELNISAKVDSLEAAKQVAKKLDQISVWDNAKGEEVKTGGTSQRQEFSNYPLAERLNELKGNTASDIPGFEHLSKDFHDNMEPDEREYLKGNKLLQRNAMKEYHKLSPSVPETTNAMQAGAALGGWWQRYIDVFHDLTDGGKEVANTVGPSHAETLKQWHAALSGNKSVQDANNIAWHSYADWLDAGKPTDRPSIDAIVRKTGAQPEGSGKRGNAAISDTLDKKGKVKHEGLDTTKLFNLVNSPEMKGERPFSGNAFDEGSKNPLMGTTEGARKIPSMGATVAGKGNLNRLVLDAHMRDFYGLSTTHGPAAQYIADSVHLRQAAKALGLKGGEGQEQLWGTVLGLKTLIKEGLTNPEVSGKLNADVINKIGKDYAEVMANDPEISQPGGVLDRLKDKYGIGRGAAGASEAYSKASGTRTSKAGPAGGETPVNQALLAKTAERIRGQISPSKIKKPAAAPTEGGWLSMLKNPGSKAK